ncbi:hypothetical protein [Algoriphagus machipongonensis]|uniref:Lipocalin-like domain-containing protein n=1 Tax=Algoriphagus machipongonensis TaxID=388413 RepID=A3HWP8_9BACT|nr:hypothetical protein [Algoriphagus machipongonensis]EAZ81021.1 hypothetical protein ALPR1_18333 [Algoriphagus machipongonensis]
MKIFFLLILLNLFYAEDPIQGKWKLQSYEAFLNIMKSESFQSETQSRQNEVSKDFQFAIDNTFYEFNEDSVYFTDAGAGIVKEKRGRWIIKNDTLTMLETGKVKANRFLIEKLGSKELRMRLLFLEGFIAKSELVFVKMD